MSPRKEEPQATSGVTFRVPDFVDGEGIEYTNIQVVVEMDGGIRETANFAEALQSPLKTRDDVAR
jgi:hypothetical protein